MRSSGDVTIKFKTAGNFTIESSTYNYFGSRVNGDFKKEVDVQILSPVPQFAGIAGDCSGVTLRVQTPQQGVTYTWNTSPSTTGTTAFYSNVGGVTVSNVVATSATCPGQPSGGNGIPPIPPVFGSIFGSNFLCPNDGTAGSFNLSINQCSPNITWAGTTSGAVLLNSSGSTGFGSTATFDFVNGPGNYVIQATMTGTLTGSFTTFFSVEVAFPGDSRCEVFLVDPKSNGNSENALKAFVNRLVVYPNPANNVLNVANLSDAKEVQVYSILGQMVCNQPVEAQQTMLQMDVSKLGNGSYVVVIVKNNGQRETQKIQIQK